VRRLWTTASRASKKWSPWSTGRVASAGLLAIRYDKVLLRNPQVFSIRPVKDIFMVKPWPVRFFADLPPLGRFGAYLFLESRALIW
jgi:hypothetical protein